MFNDQQIERLSAPIQPSRIKTRQKGNMTLSYLEGHDLINAANRIFGFGGWSYRITGLEQISEEVNHNDNVVVGYKATVEATVYDPFHKSTVSREDVGFGVGIGKDYATAHESAGKEAVTDAMKRAFRTFGNQFGNSLYDKGHTNAQPNTSTRQPVEQKPMQTAKEDFTALKALGLEVVTFGDRLIVRGKTFGKQQTLKEHGFYWDAARKVWHKPLEKAAA